MGVLLCGTKMAEIRATAEEKEATILIPLKETQRESDSGHIPGRYQWEETVDVSKDDESSK